MRIANEHGFAELNAFPGCTQIVVSNVAFVYPKHRGKGYGTKNHKLRVERSRLLGYDYFICTVSSKNLVELHILRQNNFKCLDTFRSTKTGNLLHIYGRQITDEDVKGEITLS